MKSVSRRKSGKSSRAVFMRTAASALIAASPCLYSGVAMAGAMEAAPGVSPVASEQKTLGLGPVRDLLAVPLGARSSDAVIVPSAVTISPAASGVLDVIENADPLTVGDADAAISFDGGQDDVTVANSGDLTGGRGIDISSGAFTPDDVLSDVTEEYAFGAYSRPLYDDAGNLVLTPDGYAQYVPTVDVVARARLTAIRENAQDTVISIGNSGKIDFSGDRGISARNPAGELIHIGNSGDITATGDEDGRAGIYASTELSTYERVDLPFVPGTYTYNAYGQLTDVVEPGQLVTDIHVVDQFYDGGAIDIVNSGNIDMGEVAQSYYALVNPTKASVGILAKGDGGTTIQNSGDISVSHHSAGISAYSTGAITIVNAGEIEIGNHSLGIAADLSDGSLGDYRIGGDVYLLNTGDIHGGITKEEAVDGLGVSAIGISIDSKGSNNEYYAAKAHLNQIYAAYNEQLGEEVYQLLDAPKLKLYNMTAVNEGRIALGDGSRGIAITPWAGYSTAINKGTIVVGDGTSIAAYNMSRRSAGILQSNFAQQGVGTMTSVNAEGGIIVTGDDSAGIAHYNLGGSSYVLNDGSITTGNGLVERIENYYGAYDRPFQSAAIMSFSSSISFGTLSYVQNTGSITVGDFAIGSFVSGQSVPLIDDFRITGFNNNGGAIKTGDNSTGMFTGGTNVTSVNTGTIAIGDLDIAGYQTNYATADEFAQQGFGMVSAGDRLATTINDGTITTGDGTVGAAAFTYTLSQGLAATVSQGETGVIATGDNSTGILARSNYYAAVGNDGRVTTGANSTGVLIEAGKVSVPVFVDRQTSAGGAYGLPGDPVLAQVQTGVTILINNGIIETGDNSTGVNVQGVQKGVEYDGQAVVLLDDYQYYYTSVSGKVDVIGDAYLRNTGTIRAGANSTAVNLSGRGVGYLDATLYNIGTIEAGAGGTALSVNADNDVDSVIVNGGTIIGDIRLGDGNDSFLHAQNVAASGQVLGAGNIVMNGNTVDFGGGEDRFIVNGGIISVVGGDNLITGENLSVEMTNGAIEARDAFITGVPSPVAAASLARAVAAAPSFSTLTINGDVSGSFSFAADVGSDNSSDRLIIAGDVAEDSTIGIVLNPVEQLKGEFAFKPITIEGTNNAESIDLLGLSGDYADSLVGSEVRFDEASGDVTVAVTFGMGHMATAANAATVMGQNWLTRSFGSSSSRNIAKYTNREGDGLTMWATAFQDEGTITPSNDLQDVSFRQIVSGIQGGVQWSQEVGGGRISVSPMFTYGTAEANLNASTSSARGKPWAIGLNANYTFDNGLYLDAVYQNMSMTVDMKTPQTAAQATGEVKVKGQGANVELGYSYKLKSGLTLEPQLQVTHVDVNLDDFASSDGIYSLTGIDGKTTTLRAGVNLFKVFPTANGSITPLVGVSYLNALNGESTLLSNGVEFGSDTSGSGYRAEVGVVGRYKAWDLDGRIGFTKTDASGTVFQPRLTVRYSW